MMFKVFVMVNGRVVADRQFFGSADTISRSDWEEIIQKGVDELRNRQNKETEGQLELELKFEEVK